MSLVRCYSIHFSLVRFIPNLSCKLFEGATGAHQEQGNVFTNSISEHPEVEQIPTLNEPQKQQKQYVATQREPSIPSHLGPPMASEGREPTVEDLQRFRPRHIPDPVFQTHRYKQTYKAARDSLGRSFTRDQLHSFVGKLLGITPSRRSRKGDLLDLILSKAWGLSSPAQLENERRERTEIKKKGKH